jgi:hypothetical protein
MRINEGVVGSFILARVCPPKPTIQTQEDNGNNDANHDEWNSECTGLASAALVKDTFSCGTRNATWAPFVRTKSGRSMCFTTFGPGKLLFGWGHQPAILNLIERVALIFGIGIG